MGLDAEGRRLRARAAALRKHHPDQPEAGAEERRVLRANAIERYIREQVDLWPPLSDAQRARLAVVLLSGSNGAKSGARNGNGRPRGGARSRTQSR